ncbi:hypothetical protein EVAR_36126_1 [Eumeta japonica]|uniref:Uncharacterized protein n=1 Tax=Eumeta variegata TaxID=151549 RepID=A0A4C1X595_EUMVA|nr:hypothetical protein EVAR_36126_1 [Eumeta japonica]
MFLDSIWRKILKINLKRKRADRQARCYRRQSGLAHEQPAAPPCVRIKSVTGIGMRSRTEPKSVLGLGPILRAGSESEYPQIETESGNITGTAIGIESETNWHLEQNRIDYSGIENGIAMEIMIQRVIG